MTPLEEEVLDTMNRRWLGNEDLQNLVDRFMRGDTADGEFFVALGQAIINENRVLLLRYPQCRLLREARDRLMARNGGELPYWGDCVQEAGLAGTPASTLKRWRRWAGMSRLPNRPPGRNRGHEKR
jgi:hypothetical protein